MNIDKYINAIQNHGYDGYIGEYTGPVHGSLKPGQIYLVRNLKVDTTNSFKERESRHYMKGFRSLDIPLTEEELAKNIAKGLHNRIIGYSIEFVPKEYVRKYEPKKTVISI